MPALCQYVPCRQMNLELTQQTSDVQIHTESYQDGEDS